MSKEVDQIMFDALLMSEICQYCKTCKYAYIQELTGTGYCKYPTDPLQIPPKYIKEFEWCEHWENKE